MGFETVLIDDFIWSNASIIELTPISRTTLLSIYLINDGQENHHEIIIDLVVQLVMNWLITGGSVKEKKLDLPLKMVDVWNELNEVGKVKF